MIIAFIALIVAALIASLFTRKSEEKYPSLQSPKGNLIIFDTETNGFPRNWKASISDTENWPRIVSIGWIKIAPNGSEISKSYSIVKPDNFFIDNNSIATHGITSEIALKEGTDLLNVLNDFQRDISDVSYLVAHNLEFDYPVVFSEFMRCNLDTNKLNSLKQICTMKSSTEFCKIPSRNGYKYPKLNELYIKLFKTQSIQSHNALDDAEVCLKCFKELYNQKIIKF